MHVTGFLPLLKSAFNWRLFLCFYLFCVLTSNNTQAGSYTIGVERLNYQPYFFIEKSEYRGFSRELLDLFARHYQHQFRFEVLPVKRLYNVFFKSQLDFKFPDNAYWKASRRASIDVYYSKPVIGYIDGIMVLASNGAYISSLKHIGTVSGFTPWPYLDLIKDKKMKLTEHFTIEGIVRQVIVRRLQGAYLNIEVAKYQLRLLGKEDVLRFARDLPHVDDHYYLSTTKHPKVLKEFNQFLVKYKIEIDALKRRYKLL